MTNIYQASLRMTINYWIKKEEGGSWRRSLQLPPSRKPQKAVILSVTKWSEESHFY